MAILEQIYTMLIVQPAYNVVMGIYSGLAQEQAWLTCILIGIIAAALFVPLMINGYFDQLKTRQLQGQIEAIQENEPNPEKQQEQIMKLLRKKQIRFQSESIFLAGLAVILAFFYSVFLNHWQEFNPEMLYSFITPPTNFSPIIGSINLGYSSPTLSLLPAILLYFELHQSYKEQKFLTSFIDRWYAVILPLFIYFLIFWLPSALSLIMASALAVSLYLRFLLNRFTALRHRQPAAAKS